MRTSTPEKNQSLQSSSKILIEACLQASNLPLLVSCFSIILTSVLGTTLLHSQSKFSYVPSTSHVELASGRSCPMPCTVLMTPALKCMVDTGVIWCSKDHTGSSSLAWCSRRDCCCWQPQMLWQTGQN